MARFDFAGCRSLSASSGPWAAWASRPACQLRRKSPDPVTLSRRWRLLPVIFWYCPDQFTPSPSTALDSSLSYHYSIKSIASASTPAGSASGSDRLRPISNWSLPGRCFAKLIYYHPSHLVFQTYSTLSSGPWSSAHSIWLGRLFRLAIICHRPRSQPCRHNFPHSTWWRLTCPWSPSR